MEYNKLKRMEYLEATLWKYLNTEPRLTAEDLAVVLAEQICNEDLPKFIKKYKKETKYTCG